IRSPAKASRQIVTIVTPRGQPRRPHASHPRRALSQQIGSAVKQHQALLKVNLPCVTFRETILS
ncbi:hypothetical protein, partial [Enterobacter hormaechei]|uniref:hypothetical protein n=1 Tax=Enterobacter hormaechei TaxID=158836 RepID=UPI001953051F